ncbi:DNA ligase [Pseudoxanthomonas sp. PXM03]|uniref:DNA ligase n=1 Tax=Pseudoxanthomonas sp. PXM03 TaxID=2769284 RepID=UPI0017807C23|nr:DNA ligase [Pseudoxanthomonas sp. PXM03]MBD9435251.1 DNA ligase [Pseudoxanthomonas sp. PXM03]
MRLILTALLCLLIWPVLSAPPPDPMLATPYRDGVPVAAFLVSEKLDGVRARWDGRALWTRGGARIAAPATFTRGWSAEPMDGELWIARGRFDDISALVRRVGTDAQAWRDVRFMVFDLPTHPGPFAERVVRMRSVVSTARNAHLVMIPQQRVDTRAELDAELARVVAAGGEGLMLHRRDARYRAGRSEDLLKYKPHEDAEAQVVAHLPGKGKYAGMMGALQVRTPDGRHFRIGTGFTDAQRAKPPPVGAWLTYRYNGLTSTGLPRFARFMRMRDDMPPADPKR